VPDLDLRPLQDPPDRTGRLDLVELGLDHSSDQVVLGPEVVMDIPDRDVRGLCDIGERGGRDALAVQPFARAGDEPFALAATRAW